MFPPPPPFPAAQTSTSSAPPSWYSRQLEDEQDAEIDALGERFFEGYVPQAKLTVSDVDASGAGRSAPDFSLPTLASDVPDYPNAHVGHAVRAFRSGSVSNDAPGEKLRDRPDLYALFFPSTGKIQPNDEGGQYSVDPPTFTSRWIDTSAPTAAAYTREGISCGVYSTAAALRGATSQPVLPSCSGVTESGATSAPSVRHHPYAHARSASSTSLRASAPSFYPSSSSSTTLTGQASYASLSSSSTSAPSFEEPATPTCTWAFEHPTSRFHPSPPVPAIPTVSAFQPHAYATGSDPSYTDMRGHGAQSQSRGNGTIEPHLFLTGITGGSGSGLHDGKAAAATDDAAAWRAIKGRGLTVWPSAEDVELDSESEDDYAEEVQEAETEFATATQTTDQSRADATPALTPRVSGGGLGVANGLQVALADEQEEEEEEDVPLSRARRGRTDEATVVRIKAGGTGTKKGRKGTRHGGKRSKPANSKVKSSARSKTTVEGQTRAEGRSEAKGEGRDARAQPKAVKSDVDIASAPVVDVKEEYANGVEVALPLSPAPDESTADELICAALSTPPLPVTKTQPASLAAATARSSSSRASTIRQELPRVNPNRPVRRAVLRQRYLRRALAPLTSSSPTQPKSDSDSDSDSDADADADDDDADWEDQSAELDLDGDDLAGSADEAYGSRRSRASASTFGARASTTAVARHKEKRVFVSGSTPRRQGGRRAISDPEVRAKVDSLVARLWGRGGRERLMKSCAREDLMVIPDFETFWEEAGPYVMCSQTKRSAFDKQLSNHGFTRATVASLTATPSRPGQVCKTLFHPALKGDLAQVQAAMENRKQLQKFGKGIKQEIAEAASSSSLASASASTSDPKPSGHAVGAAARVRSRTYPKIKAETRESDLVVLTAQVAALQLDNGRYRHALGMVRERAPEMFTEDFVKAIGLNMGEFGFGPSAMGPDLDDKKLEPDTGPSSALPAKVISALTGKRSRDMCASSSSDTTGARAPAHASASRNDIAPLDAKLEADVCSGDSGPDAAPPPVPAPMVEIADMAGKRLSRKRSKLISGARRD